MDVPIKNFAYTGLWLALISFIIGFYNFYERIHPDDFLTPFKIRKYPDKFMISFPTLLAQPDNITCGPTSTTMILNRYNKSVTLDEVKIKTKTVWFRYNNEDIGMTFPDFIESALNFYGVSCRMRQGNLHLLKYQVSNTKPCIVLVRSGESNWHYLIVIGYDPEYFWIADPASGSIFSMSTQTFLDCWSWKADTTGNPCQQSYLIILLEMAEVHPNTIIFPDHGINH